MSRMAFFLSEKEDVKARSLSFCYPIAFFYQSMTLLFNYFLLFIYRFGGRGSTRAGLNMGGVKATPPMRHLDC